MVLKIANYPAGATAGAKPGKFYYLVYYLNINSTNVTTTKGKHDSDYANFSLYS